MLVDAERTLVVAAVADAWCYSYTLFAFVVHALGGSRTVVAQPAMAATTTGAMDNATVANVTVAVVVADDAHVHLFAEHDEPELLAHATHALLALMVVCSFACLRTSVSLACLRVTVAVAAFAACIDAAAAYTHWQHAREGSHASVHPQPVGYLYALLASTLVVTSCCVARQARHVGLAFDPIAYGSTPRVRERRRAEAVEPINISV